MRTTSFVLLVALLLDVPRPFASPLALTRAEVREALGEPPNFAQMQYAPAELHLRPDVPGLSLTTEFNRREARSARLLATLLHQRLGLTLGLASAVDGIDVPAFDGLVLDEDENVVANFSLKTTRNLIKLKEALARAVRRIDTFSVLLNWPQFVLNALAEQIHGEREHPGELTLHTEYYARRYHRLVNASRRMIETYGVSNGRPTWILVDLLDATPLTLDQLEELQALLSAESLATRLYLHQGGRLTMVRAERIEFYPACARFLAPF